MEHTRGSLHYVDLMPGGMHRQYTWIQEHRLLQFSRAPISSAVDRDVDPQQRPIAVARPVDAEARQRLGVQSRVIDDTGFVQPAIRQPRAVRGTRSIYPNNAIQTWRVDPSGEVSNCRSSGALLMLLALPALAAPLHYGFGKPATPAQFAGWDIDVRPDGAGLPAGRGSVKEGEAIYDDKCASCHGTFGESNSYLQIAGGVGSLGSDQSTRTTGSKLNYATGSPTRRTPPA